MGCCGSAAAKTPKQGGQGPEFAELPIVVAPKHGGQGPDPASAELPTVVAPELKQETGGTAGVDGAKEISKEVFKAAMSKVLTLAIEGYPRGLRSTMANRNELLRETNGDQEAATEIIKARAAALSEEGKSWLIGLVPYVGLPASVLYPTWKIMRRVCLLAAVMGLDLSLEDTRGRILHAFAGLRSVPAAEFAVETVVQAIWVLFAGPIAGVIPVGMLVTKVTNIEGAVLGQVGSDTFSEKSRPIPKEEYLPELDPEPTSADYIALAKEGTSAALLTVWGTMTEREKRDAALQVSRERGKQVGEYGTQAAAIGLALASDAASAVAVRGSTLADRVTVQMNNTTNAALGVSRNSEN